MKKSPALKAAAERAVHDEPKSGIAVLVIEHPHGTDVCAYHDEAAARAHLASCVRDFWPSYRDGTPPAEDAAAVAAYYADDGEVEGQWYTLRTVTIS